MMDERESALMLANVRLNSLRRALDKHPAGEPIDLTDGELQRMMRELRESLDAAEVNADSIGLTALIDIAFSHGLTLKPDSAAGLRSMLKLIAATLEKAGETRSHLRLV